MGKFRQKYESTIAKAIEYIRGDGTVGGEIVGRQERLDPTPIAPPLGFHREPSLHEKIRDMILSQQAHAELRAAGLETFEESEDFDIPDDPVDPLTPYEREFDPEIIATKEELLEVRRRDRLDPNWREKEEAAAAPPAPAPQQNATNSGGDQPTTVTKPAQPA